MIDGSVGMNGFPDLPVYAQNEPSFPLFFYELNSNGTAEMTGVEVYKNL